MIELLVALIVLLIAIKIICAVTSCAIRAFVVLLALCVLYTLFI